MKIKNLSLVLLLSAFIVITGVIFLKNYETETLVDAKWNEKEDTLLAITIEGEEVSSFPTTKNYTASVICTKGSGTALWNGNKWVFNAIGINQTKTKCNVNFETIPTWDTPKAGTLLAAIKRDNTVSIPTTTPGSEVSADTEAVLASTQDDYGTSYYFRGAVTNNFVEYANMCWRIVRVTGNGSIKLVLYNYNGLTSTNNTPASSTPCNVTGNTYAFARYEGDAYKSRFNSNSEDNTYVGFMYGTAGASSYIATHANTNPSTMLTNLNKWYTNVLSKQANFNDSQLADTIWCNDKSVVTETAFNPSSFRLGTNYGYAKNASYYSATKRLVQASSASAGGTGPSLICPNDNNGGKLSKFTVSDTTYGNGALGGYAKVGLLTADEIAFAGGSYLTANSTYYIHGNANDFWWVLSPYAFTGSFARVWDAHNDSSLNYYRADMWDILYNDSSLGDGYHGVRPSLSLQSGVKISSSGIGSATNPYKIAA